MFCIKTTVFILLVTYSVNSCGFSRASSNRLVENDKIGKQPPAADEQNINVLSNTESIKSANLDQRIFSNSKYANSYQIKPRRRKINFQDDCQYIAGNGDEYLLEKTCADALQAIKPGLPKECEYNTFRDRDGNTYFSFFETAQIKFYPLSANKYLAELRCQTGAYNVQNVYLLYDESAIPAKAEVLEFLSLEFISDEDSDVAKSVEKVKVKIIGGRYFNPKTKELVVFVKSRGIGDAGEYAKYSFPNGKPKLEEFRAKFKWSGRGYQVPDVIKSPPKTWKRYYP